MSELGACWRCVYFDRNPEEREEGGFCRRFPPLSAYGEDGNAFPGVGFIDWCGEFREGEDE